MNRDIRDCSGPWKGTWDQPPVRGTMAFSLRFRGDRILGEGTDRDGPFSMEGEVDGSRVYLHKAYPWLSVRYDGVWNGSFVAGRSTIGRLAHGQFGTFEIWPEDEETPIGIEERELEAVGPSGDKP